MTTRKNLPGPAWVTLPVPAGHEPPALFEGDSYLVQRATGEVLWCAYVDRNGCKVFEPCDADGEPIDESLEDVTAVLATGYGPGVADAVITAASHAQTLLGPRYHAEELISGREPLLSADRDSRHQEAR
jgi:hypothetical protein